MKYMHRHSSVEAITSGSTMAAVNTELLDLDEESLVARQKKEKKDLQANIQKLKNSVPKGDKQKRKMLMRKFQNWNKA